MAITLTFFGELPINIMKGLSVRWGWQQPKTKIRKGGI